MLVVVGGHSRNIGKTSVVEGLIRALPQGNWTAVKVTQYGHGVCSKAGKPCQCAVEQEHPYAVTEERDPGRADSRRYLGAGARRAFWVRTATGQLAHAVLPLRQILETSENTIVESNSLLQFFAPDLYLVVLDFAVKDFKPSSLKYLDRADALILIDRGMDCPAWSGVTTASWEEKPNFRVNPPQFVTEAVADFVRGRLSPATSTASSGVSAGPRG